MATFYKIPTEIHDTWIWNSSEPLYFKWWADLQYMASYTNREYLVGNEIVNLKPGQLVASIDFLVKRWGKSKNMIIRYLKLLCKDGYIRKESSHNVSIITILFNAGFGNVIGDNLKDNPSHTANDLKSDIYKTEETYIEDNLKDNLKDNLEDNLRDRNKKRKKEKITTTPARARAKETLSGASTTEVLSPTEQRRTQKGIPVLTEVGMEIIANDKHYLLRLQRDTGIMKENIVKWISFFVKETKRQHEDMDDLCRHFTNWLFKKKEAGETPEAYIISITSPLQAQEAWIKCAASLILCDPKCESIVNLLSFAALKENTIQLIAPSKEEAKKTKILKPAIEKWLSENVSSKMEVAFGINTTQVNSKK